MDKGASASPTALAPPSGMEPASGLQQSRSSTGAGRDCTCLEVYGEDPQCRLHGRDTAWGQANPDDGGRE